MGILASLGLAAFASAQVPNFSFFPVGPTDGVAVDFFPVFGASTRCDWDFGDPVNNPPIQDPSCSQQAATYQTNGIFVVTLTVQPSGTSITKEVGVLTTANTQNNLTPAFTPSNSTPNVNEPVVFTDDTTPANSVGHWIWDFGDGSASYAHHPTHAYQAFGPFTVTLTVENNQTGEPGPSTSQVITVSLPATPTPTPTQTPIPSDTPTQTLPPPITPTGQATSTPTPTGPPGSPTVTPTLAASPTGTVPPTGTATPTGSVTVNVTSTRTKTPTRTPLPSPQLLVGYIPVVGSVPGNLGSFFRTSVQLFNPGASATSGRFVFHRVGVTGVPNDPSLLWSLAPGQTVPYADVVTTMGQSGLGSLDVLVSQGAPLPVILTRIYDDGGAAGTSGFTEPFYRTSDVPANGSGYLLGPLDTARFRYNIGVRTLGSPVTLTATVRNADGGVVHTVTNEYPKNIFLQTSAANFLGFSLASNESIQLTYSGGGLIAYGATVDNVTNDPSAQFLGTGATQIASALPSRTSPGTGPRSGSATPVLFAAILAMLGLGVAAVVARR